MRALIIPPDNPNLRYRLWWFEHNGFNYQLSCFARDGSDAEIAAIGDNLLNYTRQVSKEDLAKIEVERLRVVKALANDNIDEFLVRTGNVWPKDKFTRINRLDNQASLQLDQLLKIARREPLLK